MSLHSVTANKLQILWFLFYVLIFFTFILSYGAQAIATNEKVTKVGAIIDMNSPIGKQEKIAMEIAAQSFNKSSRGHKLFISFHDSAQDSLRAASLARKILEEEKPNVIIGMETWSEAALVAKVGNEAQVPFISFSTPSITSSLMQLRWPFLITMQNHDSLQELNYIADLVCAYNWKKLVVIREDDEYSTDLGTFSHLNEVLQKVGSEIEYHLVLPPYSSVSNPKGVVLDQLVNLLKVQSRAFIVLQSSLPMMTHLFKEAKRLGLMEKDSVWIITESITSLLDFVDNSVLSNMEGVLGVSTYYSKNTTSYTNFHNHFQKMFQTMNTKELDMNPGIYALRAYDSIITITQAIEKMSDNNISSKVLLENILTSNFDGLSGNIQFNEGNLVENTSLRIVNVVGKKGYKELDFWKQGFGFFTKENGEKESSRSNGVMCKTSEGLNGSVVWPGNLESKRKPKGWAMPTYENPLRIGVPGKTSFKKFVKVDWSKNYTNEGYEGFCIQIFKEVVKRLDYDLPYKFEGFNGTYPDLVDHVYWKTFDAVVGDITIISNRTRYVEFTQPYAESGLSMVVPIKPEDSLWLFVKPFTWDTWVVTFSILFYTMVIVWFLEHPTNPKFNGSLKDQIGTSLWFTFSSLFFTHREKIRSNLTRVVVTMWLFVVLILSSSYTASLSSMLTVKQLEPLRDVDWLKRTNQKVGVDGDSFVLKYLQDVLDFNSSNIYKVVDEYSYGGDFANKTITAAFLELPYEKVFLNKYCKDFTTASPTFRFGGLGFAFQKGSPIARDVSEAILSLLEDGTITKLQKDCLTPSDECTDNFGSNKTESLSLKSFWGIYLISCATSTICLLISLIRLLKNFKHHQQQANGDNQTTTNMSIWKKGAELAKYFYKGAVDSPGKASSINSARMARNLQEWSSSRWEIISISDAPDQSQATTPPLEIEVAYR